MGTASTRVAERMDFIKEGLLRWQQVYRDDIARDKVRNGREVPVAGRRRIWEELRWHTVLAGIAEKTGEGICYKLSWANGETAKVLCLESESTT